MVDLFGQIWAVGGGAALQAQENRGPIWPQSLSSDEGGRTLEGRGRAPNPVDNKEADGEEKGGEELGIKADKKKR